MQAIILLLNAIFAKLTTAVNKAFTKSQRGTLTFVLPAGTDLSGATWSEENVDTGGEGLNYRLQEMNRGAGLYVVNLTTADGSITAGTDDIGTGSTLVYYCDFDNGQCDLISSTPSTKKVVEAATVEAVLLAAAAKSQAIAAAAADATTKANNAKIQAIEAAALDATAKADQALTDAQDYANNAANNAKDDAITAAASDATTKANTALTSAQQYTSANIAVALQTAHADAFNLALTVEQNAVAVAEQEAANAVTTSNLYTDAEIAKLQQYASIGIKSYKTFEGLVTTVGANSTIANLPSYVAFGIPTTETGAHIINVTGVNADGSIVDDKEFTLTVPTGVDANGNATTTNIVVSTNDKLIVELYKLADGSFFMKYLQKYDDRLMEVVKQLMLKIETQVSESELLSAVTDVKTYVDAQINAALV